MEQGTDLFENQELPVAAGVLDFVLVTHAHIDHSGLLPLLYKNGFRGAVYATAATCSLLDIMLRDCAHIQMSEAEWKSRKAMRRGEGPVEPLYDLNDVVGLMTLLRPCEYESKIQVNESVTIRFTTSGTFWDRRPSRYGSVKTAARKRSSFPVISETSISPYSATRSISIKPIISSLNPPTATATTPTSGRTTLPRFPPASSARSTAAAMSLSLRLPSAGRRRCCIYPRDKNRGLIKGHDGFPVYVDSPLAIEATSVFLQCDSSYVDEDMRRIIRSGENPLCFDGLHLAVSQEESKAINEDKTPKVIISASGMCDAGRIRHHLKHNLWRPECLVLFVGYQAVGTLGRALHDGAKEVKLFNEEIEAEAEIAALPGVSGHADKRGLIAWLEGFSEKPELIFVNHGDPESADSFTACLNNELGYRAFAPYSGTEFDIAAGRFTVITEGKPIVHEHKAPTAERKVNPLFTELVRAAEALMQAVRGCEGRSNRDLRSFADSVRKLTDKIKR